jgi:Flp pilus assembly protein TadG
MFRRFRRDQSGVVGVEFALIAIPFVALLFASLEGALVFWSNQVLDEAVAQASRTLYTGGFQRQTLTVPAAQIPDLFKKEVCDRVKGLLNCKEIKTIGSRGCSTARKSRSMSARSSLSAMACPRRS